MLLLGAFRPCDPGIEIDNRPAGSLPLTGWVIYNLTREHANTLLDRVAWFNLLKKDRQDLVNMCISVVDDLELVIKQPCDELANLWSQHRYEGSKLARLPESISLRDIGGVTRVVSEMTVDMGISTDGIWYQIFMPDVQFSMETPIIPQALLLAAAGIPVDADAAAE